MKINKYRCSSCTNKFITGDIDEGTTPFSLTCNKCNETMVSECYPRNLQGEKPELFWFAPSPKQLPQQVQWELDFFGVGEFVPYQQALSLQQIHVDKGGLVLAPSEEKIKDWSHVN